MLLLCQGGVSSMRKDGESLAWNHHKQGFQGESLLTAARHAKQKKKKGTKTAAFGFLSQESEVRYGGKMLFL